MSWLLSGKMPFPPMLKRLHTLAEEEAKRSGQSPRLAFDRIGLILFEELDDFDYTSTPLNVSSFATTGGDGVHYSLLHIDGQVTDESSVVMSVPMMGLAGNLIVGETLHDFLCLGCEIGYFWLEQLVYDRADTIEKLTHPARYEHASLLRVLRDAFELIPWVGIEDRLDELQARYRSRLEISKDAQ